MLMVFSEFAQIKISFKNDVGLKEMENDGRTIQPREN